MGTGKGLWIQVGVLALRHPKTYAAGPVAAWLWIASIGYAREFMTDGFVAKHVIPTLVPTLRPKGAFLHAAKLVEVGLFDDTVGGYQIHDFLEWNPSRAELDEKWQADRRRKESRRNPDGIQEDNRVSLARAPSASVSDSVPRVGTSEHSSSKTADRVALIDGTAGKAFDDDRVQALIRVCAELPEQSRVDAATFHRWIEQRLKSQRLPVRREVQINDRGDSHTGFIDLVVDGNPPLGIELDYRTPRGRSLSKLTALGGLSVIVLREAHGVTQAIPGVLIIACAELPVETSGRVSPAEALQTDAPVSALAPVWRPPADRRVSLARSHAQCHPAARAACGRGSCVPPFIVAEWRQACESAGLAEDIEIAKTVGNALASVPDGYVFAPTDPPKYWRSWWATTHGPAPMADTKPQSATAHTMAAARAVLGEL